MIRSCSAAFAAATIVAHPLFVSSDAWADDAATSTASLAGKAERPTEGPGSLISDDEAMPPKPPTAAEADAASTFDARLETFRRDLAYFEKGAQSFAADMKGTIALEYAEQRDLLAAQYDRAIDELEKEERARRLDAIARFEEFLRKYPNDPVYTPDTMFRLAELYFEKSSDEYLARSRAYETELARWEGSQQGAEPEAPQPSYEKTIGLHYDLLARFPDYRLADAARYLLGYCYGEQGQNDQAMAAYRELVDRYPNSRFIAEAWTRIGEIHFDGSDKASLENAVAAYMKVRGFPNSPYFDKALYKIAWTYYRLDRFDDAVRSFIELVDYADEQKQRTGVSGSELRTEAIQYIAISLADEDWGGLDRAKTVLNAIEAKPYTGELWKRYGEILYDQTRYEPAIAVLRYTIEKYPNAAHNPEAQEKIVRAYEQLRDFDGATAAREKLVANYSEGSDWHRANAGDREAIYKAADLTERSLYTAAIFRHQQAQAFKGSGRLEDARRSYVSAAAAYEAYLKRFPRSRNSYDFEYFLAECLYYSDDYDRAVEQYDKVRDSKIDNKHLEAAALSSVITHEKQIDREIAKGKIPKLELTTAAQRGGKKIAPVPLHPLRQSLVEASDRYVVLVPAGERTPAIAYRAAELFYRHDQFDEARRRFEAVVGAYPKNEVARYASNLIIESYLAGEDYAAVEKWSQRLIEVAQAGTPEAAKGGKSEFIENLKVFKVGAQFKQAERFDADGKFEDAADTYVRLVNDNPEHEFADKALFNAAIAYEKVKRFETASGIYRRIFDEYPKSELAPRSLFRVGINAEKGFDFASAVTAYSSLVDKYPKSENRADALYNVAVVLENQQQYAKAAKAFKNYAETFPKRDDAGEVFFRSALVYEKMKAWPEMIDTLQAFIDRYRGVRAQQERVIEAHALIGDAYGKRQDEGKAQLAYKTCGSEFARMRLPMTSKAAADAAHCAFELSEAEFRRYDKLAITGTSRNQVNILNQKAQMQRGLEKQYADVFKYKRVETTLAASYRIGHSYERFAESLFSAPVPKEFEGKEEYEAEYKAQLEEKASVLERKAEAAYRKAYEEAKKSRVTNEWTQRILEGLNKYAPKEFPIQKLGKPLMQTDTITGNGLDDMGTLRSKASGPAASLPESSDPRTVVATTER